MAISSNDIGANLVATDQPARLAQSGASDRVRSEMRAADYTSYDANSGQKFPQNPTVLTYGHFIVAYDFFNGRLFAGLLPGCLITMQRKKGARGFFHGNRFGSRDQADITDEIALNPATFAVRDDRAILSTLVHEMAHLWQHHFGKPSEFGYHNREWATKMVELGLVPSHTGKSGGRQTGRRVTHYIEADGPFDRACEELLLSGVLIAYVQRGDDERGETVRAKKAASKTRYTCAGCGLNVWGKPDIRVICATCSRPLLPSSTGA